MTTAEIIRLELELSRSMRAREDAIAMRLLDRMRRERTEPQPVDVPDLERIEEVCICGNMLEPWDVTACEACRRGRR